VRNAATQQVSGPALGKADGGLVGAIGWRNEGMGSAATVTFEFDKRHPPSRDPNVVQVECAITFLFPMFSLLSQWYVRPASVPCREKNARKKASQNRDCPRSAHSGSATATAEAPSQQGRASHDPQKKNRDELAAADWAVCTSGVTTCARQGKFS